MDILQGLRMIKRIGLPHPDWELVRSAADLIKYYDQKAPVGWTIRKVAVTTGQWKSIYANHVTRALVPKTVAQLQRQSGNQGVFAVYPSWYWIRCGTILIEKGEVTIETTRGHIHELLRDGTVEATYRYRNGKLIATTGNTRAVSPTLRRQMVRACTKVSPRRSYIIEWGITTQHKPIFYTLDEVTHYAKKLIKKYG